MRYETPAFSVEGRRLLVCGAGVAGAAVVRALLRLDAASVAVSDRLHSDAVRDLQADGVDFVGEVAAAPPGTDLVIASPGWSMAAPVFAAARASGIAVLGEIELAWRLRGPGAAPWPPPPPGRCCSPRSDT